MRRPSSKEIATQIAGMAPKKAADKLRELFSTKGRDLVENILFELACIDRDHHGQSDEWWLEVKYEAGEEISSLY